MSQPQHNTLDRIIRAIPVIGFAHRCMEENRPWHLALLVLNVLLLTAVAVSIWGFPAFITAMLIFTALVGTTVVLATLG